MYPLAALLKLIQPPKVQPSPLLESAGPQRNPSIQQNVVDLYQNKKIGNNFI